VRITFVVPDFARVPVGGMKVAYEFANRLAARGHQVTLLHLDTMRHQRRSLRWRRDARFLAWRIGLGGWFRLTRDVRAGLIDPARPDLIPPGDRLLAVGWKTVAIVAEAASRAGRQVYMAMDYMADWEGDPGEVDAAWLRPMPKIVTAEWLARKARDLCGDGVSISMVPLAVGVEHMVEIDPSQRVPTSLAMHFHPGPSKGLAEGLEALALVRRGHPVRLVAFGGFPPERPLAEWIDFRLGPRDLVPIYNSAAIFVHSSIHEGFGLPPAEAMASGCALTAFANLGVSEFAVDGHNALLVPVGDVEGLANAITRLIEDDELRIRLARQGIADIRTRTWERSVTAMEEALSEAT
jgi:glycosyltransferase involved in cell wall biosynthesis